MKNKINKKADTRNPNVWALIKMRQKDFNTEYKYKLEELPIFRFLTKIFDCHDYQQKLQEHECP